MSYGVKKLKNKRLWKGYRYESIKIYSWGEVRTPGLNIRVNNKTIFDEYNLLSHNEWHP